jgi:DNA mismatch endonuclease (patch repair protein)
MTSFGTSGRMDNSAQRIKRSEIMRCVKSKNTSPEIKLRSLLFRNGIRGWRLHAKGLPGNPDIVFNTKKLAIFVDGCFWHGCSICYRRPSSNRKYWDKKLLRNILRDNKNTNELRKMGWKVLRFWEHDIYNNHIRCVNKVNFELNK